MSGTDATGPPLRLIRSFADAELVVRDWMRYWGQVDAIRVGGPADLGVDVESRKFVAQVKAMVGPIGRPIVQQTHGVAVHRGKKGLVFSLGGFTDEAIDWATEAGVGLFEFDLQGTPVPIDRDASLLAAERSDGSDKDPHRVVVEHPSEVWDWFARHSPDKGHLLITGEKEFCDNVVLGGDPPAWTTMKTPGRAYVIDARLGLLRAGSELVKVPHALGMIKADGFLLIHNIDQLTGDQSDMVERAARESRVEIALGDGLTIPPVEVQLPTFCLIGVTPNPGRMQRELLQRFDYWLIQGRPT